MAKSFRIALILPSWISGLPEGKLVLTIDYSGKPEQIADAYVRAHAHGYVPYVTDPLPWANAYQCKL